MMNTIAPKDPAFFDYQIRYADEGFPYACDCGEMWEDGESAVYCRKCRTYLMDEDFNQRSVWNVSTGNLIWTLDPLLKDRVTPETPLSP